MAVTWSCCKSFTFEVTYVIFDKNFHLKMFVCHIRRVFHVSQHVFIGFIFHFENINSTILRCIVKLGFDSMFF